VSAIAIDIEKTAAWIAGHRLDLRTDAGKQIARLIAEAIQAERKQNQEAAEIERANLMEAVDDAAKNAFEMGEHAERLRALDLVKAWGRGLNGSEYLSRSIGVLFDQIKGGGLEPQNVTAQAIEPCAQIADTWKEYAGDFNSMTDEEVERERQRAQDEVDEHESWLEAVASWEAAGKPRKAVEA
jgi:hypothetical protein